MINTSRRTASLTSTWIGGDLRRSVAAIDDPANLQRRKTDLHDRHVYLIARSTGSPIELIASILQREARR